MLNPEEYPDPPSMDNVLVLTPPPQPLLEIPLQLHTFKKLTFQTPQHLKISNANSWGGYGYFQEPLINPLNPDIKMHILITDLHTFLMKLVRRIRLNIKTSYCQ